MARRVVVGSLQKQQLVLLLTGEVAGGEMRGGGGRRTGVLGHGTARKELGERRRRRVAESSLILGCVLLPKEDRVFCLVLGFVSVLFRGSTLVGSIDKGM